MHELQNLSLTLKIASDDLAFKKIRDALAATHLTLTREDGWGVRVVVREAADVKPMHAHIALDRDDDKKTFTLQYDITRGEHVGRGRFLGSKAFLDLLRANVKQPERARRGLVSANYSFASTKWEPTFPVPFSLPATMSSLPGLPQVIGIDLSFAEQAQTQPLVRVFVTTYPELQEIVVRVLMRSETALVDPLATRLVQAAQAQLPAFVRKCTES